MSQMEFTLYGDANPLLKAFSRVRSAARAMGKEVNNVLQMPVAGEGAQRAAKAAGGLRGMLASGIGSGVARLGGIAAGIFGTSALVHRGLEAGKAAAETVKDARESGLSPSDYAALQIATQRYGQSITENTAKLVAAMNEIKNSGEVLSDVDLNKLAKDSTQLSASMNKLGNAFTPVNKALTAATAAWADKLAGVVRDLIALLHSNDPTESYLGRNEERYNAAQRVLAGLPDVTPVDPVAVAASLKKNKPGTSATLAPFRITATDPLSRIGLYEGPAQKMPGEQAKVGTELLKEARMQTEQLRKLNDNTKDL